MNDNLAIPADMIQGRYGCAAMVSIRDMLIALGASDEVLREAGERQEILEREPWRKAARRFIVIGESVDGVQFGYMTGEIDWSGTKFQETSNNP